MNEHDECYCESCDYNFLLLMVSKKLCPRCRSFKWHVTKPAPLEVNASVFLERRKQKQIYAKGI
ncbi:hypothetical protein_gp023 [Bacillus phage vB_BceM_WH1]|nr:hypothetical protein_gp023 [Bacillus phage vB_BceM_WH1]